MFFNDQYLINYLTDHITMFRNRYFSNYANNWIKTKRIRKIGSELCTKTIVKNPNRKSVAENYQPKNSLPVYWSIYVYLVASRLQIFFLKCLASRPRSRRYRVSWYLPILLVYVNEHFLGAKLVHHDIWSTLAAFFNAQFHQLRVRMQEPPRRSVSRPNGGGIIVIRYVKKRSLCFP